MQANLDSSPITAAEGDWLVVPVFDSAEQTGHIAELNDTMNGAISALREAGDLTGKPNETLAIHQPQSIAASRLLLVGLGKPDELDATRLEHALTTAVRHVSEKQISRLAFVLPDLSSQSLSIDAFVCTIGCCAVVGSTGQGLYRTEQKRYPIDQLMVIGAPESTEPALRRGVVLGQSVNLTRDLVNHSPMHVYPETFAERAREVADEVGLHCDLFDNSRLETERMNALLAVAQGSERPPRVVVLEHKGAGDDADWLALVGKGVTFDSGGLSLKTSDGMKTMKSDMAGAATVLGTMTALARLNVQANVRGYLGLVENMPSGASYRPGDVLTARNGVTIEVLNTDAEGRLVLADVLSLAVDQGAKRLVDLATLTGSCVVALGEDVSGAFTNDQAWCDQVISSTRACGEYAWQLPMYDHFADLIKGDVSDVKNVGPRWGGAITAAKFLEKFVAGTPWVHLDIAGPSFASSNKSWREAGATGCMVRSMVHLCEQCGAA